MKHLILFLLTVALLAACGNEHEPVALKKLDNIQAPASVASYKQGNSPVSRGPTLDGFVAVWSSSTEQVVAQPESATTEQAAKDKPISPPQESLSPTVRRFPKPFFLTIKRKQFNSIGESSIGERPGDKVGQRAGDRE